MYIQEQNGVASATREQLIAAHTRRIFKLVQEAALSSGEADRNAGRGETNIAISYLLEIKPLLRTITALNDSALAFHGDGGEHDSVCAAGEQSHE
jgi:hypothetical protein